MIKMQICMIICNYYMKFSFHRTFYEALVPNGQLQSPHPCGDKLPTLKASQDS